MNFEFLRDLRGLGNIYENCSNAEKLAKTMPVQSVFTSRKSAELLAKFIYMAAHNQEMEGLTFADILSDSTVRSFVGSRRVMDAFHSIRKSGNRAVHSESEETFKDALSVLEDLHYVAGETALKLDLIKSYPEFESRIDTYPEAVYIDQEDIDQKAREMFLSFIETYDALKDRENYFEMKDYNWFNYSIEGNVHLHEYLEFKHKPMELGLIEYVQNYLFYLVRMSIDRSPERAEELDLEYPVTLDVKLTIGDITYSSKDIDVFCRAIDEELPKSGAFIIDCKCNGVVREFFEDESEDDGCAGRFGMIRKDTPWTGAGMFDTLAQYKRRNMFEYKLSVFYPDSGLSRYEKILNGKEIDVLSTCSESNVDMVFEDKWWTNSVSLCAEFDFEKYSEELSKLQDIVRKRVPKEELQYCEGAWKDEEYHILCNGIVWDCACLREVQSFLDEVNSILLPIKDEVNAWCDGTWDNSDRFAVATWKWTDGGFKVVGTCY